MTGSAPSIASSQEAPIVKFQARGWRGEFVADTPLHDWLKQGGRPERLDTTGELVLRDGAHTRCVRLQQLGEDLPPLHSPLFLKTYLRSGVVGWAKRLMGRHRASSVWRFSWAMLEAGVSVPRPLGYLVPLYRQPRKCSYIWTEWLSDAQHARKLAQDPGSRSRVIDNDRFADRVAAILASLHGAGLYHRDMKWANILLEDSGERIWLVDLDSARRGRPGVGAEVVRDLGRFLADAEALGASALWRTSFIERYAGRRGVDSSRLRREVERMVEVFINRRERKRDAAR